MRPLGVRATNPGEGASAPIREPKPTEILSHVRTVPTIVRPHAPSFRNPLALIPALAPPRELRRRPLLEDLEGRQMLSTFTVTTIADNGSNTSPTTGSLRAAIVAANALTAGTYSTIDFDITGTGVHEIELAAPLPAISNAVNINGLYETGSSATDPLIRIDGTDAGALATGLEILPSAYGTAATPTEVSGLEITDFSEGAVSSGASYVKLTDLFIGVAENSAGSPDDAGNDLFGISIFTGSYDTISGCVVSANKGNGVELEATSDDTLSGDFIGTDVTAKRLVDANGNTLGNAGSGVFISSAQPPTL